jgi:hypothetical protein
VVSDDVILAVRGDEFRTDKALREEAGVSEVVVLSRESKVLPLL